MINTYRNMYKLKERSEKITCPEELFFILSIVTRFQSKSLFLNGTTGTRMQLLNLGGPVLYDSGPHDFRRAFAGSSFTKSNYKQ